MCEILHAKDTSRNELLNNVSTKNSGNSHAEYLQTELVTVQVN